MTKNEFMRTLHDLLEGIPDKERQDILYDYEEHFQIALEQGKSEEEVAAMLGNPKTIAKELGANYQINQINQAKTEPTVENVGRAIIAAIALGFFNLIFILGPFLGLIGVLIGLFAAALALTIFPLAILLSFSFPSHPLEVLQMIFIMMTTGSLGVLMGIGMIYLTKWVFQGLGKYLHFNIRIIKGK